MAVAVAVVVAVRSSWWRLLYTISSVFFCPPLILSLSLSKGSIEPTLVINAVAWYYKTKHPFTVSYTVFDDLDICYVWSGNYREYRVCSLSGLYATTLTIQATQVLQISISSRVMTSTRKEQRSVVINVKSPHE